MLYCYNNQTVLGLKALQHPQHAGARVVYSSNLRNIVGLNSILRFSSSLAKIVIVSCCLRSHTWTNMGLFFWWLRDQICLKLTINYTFPGLAASSPQLQVAGFLSIAKVLCDNLHIQCHREGPSGAKQASVHVCRRNAFYHLRKADIEQFDCIAQSYIMDKTSRAARHQAEHLPWQRSAIVILECSTKLLSSFVDYTNHVSHTGINTDSPKILPF